MPATWMHQVEMRNSQTPVAEKPHTRLLDTSPPSRSEPSTLIGRVHKLGEDFVTCFM